MKQEKICKVCRGTGVSEQYDDFDRVMVFPCSKCGGTGDECNPDKEWKYRENRINKYQVYCLEDKRVDSMDGCEIVCGYENAPANCGDCVCNGGNVNPQTGRRPYKKSERQ